MKHFLSSILIFSLFILSNPANAGKIDGGGTWKAGVASVIITPEQSIWMAGFAHRTSPASGKLHDLWVKALAIEDASGKQAVLLTSDLSGIPKSISDSIRNRIERKFKFLLSLLKFIVVEIKIKIKFSSNNRQ